MFVNGTYSQWVKVTSSVPQGTILGSTFYYIIIIIIIIILLLYGKIKDYSDLII